jgi:DNA-binding response OmpR family regulator
MNIAVLEDNPAIIAYMTTALQMAGHHVAVYTRGAALFVDLFTREGVCDPLPFDVLTVDLLLPAAISGVEVITRIRRVIPPQLLPIIVISGAGVFALEQVRETFPDVAILIKQKLHTLAWPG